MPATAHPDQLPRWVTDNPLRSAEIKVYEVLKRQLPSRYRLYYSSPWLGTDPDGSEREGEADFVVASAETGFLVIEVKGGAVGRSKETGEWHSMDRGGFRHRIKNPVAQASGSKHQLLGRLRDVPALRDRWLGAGIAVVLPDSSGGELLDGLDTPRDKFALREDMEWLGAWVREQLDGNMGARGRPLGVEGIAALDHMLAHSFQLRLPLASSLENDSRQVLVATNEQCEILRVFEDHQRVAIAGIAGSGKTVLAVHKALQIAESNPARRVLLTCFNAPLGEHLRRLTARQDNIVAGQFHHVCASLARQAGMPIAAGDAVRELMDEVYPESLVAAVCKQPELAFDAIIVDEGQDFRDDWLECLNQCCASDDSTYWVFFDDNQQLYGRSGTFVARLQGRPLKLRKNVRNPRPVFERLVPLLGSINATSAGPDGQPIEEILVPESRQMPSAVARLISRLVESDQVDPEDIAVLVASKRRVAEICPELRFGRIQTCDATELPRGRVCVDTVRRFKGLERRVIILVEPAEMAESNELQYVGLSRTTGHLILVGARRTQRSAHDE